MRAKFADGVAEVKRARRVGAKEVADGTSHTIMLTEDAGRPRLWQAGTAGPDQVVAGGPWAGFNTGIIVQGSTIDGTSAGT